MNKRMMILVLVFLLVLVVAVLPASAAKKKKGRFAPGNMMVEGDLSFRLAAGGTTIEPEEGDDHETDQFYFDLALLGGYYVIRGLEIGPWVEFSYESNESDDGIGKETMWLIGPQAGYFFALNGDFSIYGLLGLGYAKNTTAYEPDADGADDTENSVGGFVLEPRFGVMYSINKHLGISPSLYFRYFSGSGTNDTGAADADYDMSQSEYGLKLGLFGFF